MKKIEVKKIATDWIRKEIRLSNVSKAVVKKIVWLGIFFMSSSFFVIAQGMEYGVNTKITTTKRCYSADNGWAWDKNQWFYNGEPMDVLPPNYTDVEEFEETIIENGKETKRCSMITIEVKTKYETSIPDWRWNGVKWLYRGKTVETFPSKYVIIKEEKKSISNQCE